MNESNKKKILIVDDVPTNITILTEILMSDYKMMCATNGKDALKLAASSTPDLILLDIMMPELDGYEVCRKLKSDEATRAIPVIFLTAKSEEADEVKGLELGAADYISKPFSASILTHKVRIHIELKLHRDHLEEIINKRTMEISKAHQELHQEIAEKILAHQALIEQRAYFLQLFENSPNGILIVEPDGKIREANKGFEKIFGYAADEIRGTYSKNLIVPEDRISENEMLHKSILSGRTVTKETYRKGRNRELIPVSFLGYPALIRDKIEGIFVLYEDISYRKKFEVQMRYQSFHDSLTGIPNRALLMERLTRAIKRSKRRENYRFAVLMIDLDDFKSVNERLGQVSGDQFLTLFSDKVKRCIRSTDTIARMGGDEFAVLLEEFNNTREVVKIAKRITGVGRSGIFIERNEVRINTSIGIVWNTDTYEHAENILRDADIAMYRVKDTGKPPFRLFKNTMRKRALESIKIKSELTRAIENNEFILHFQPIISVNRQQLTGFEALVRWQHPEKGIIGPNQFIPFAEETDLIIPIGDFVITETCRQLKHWHDTIPGAEMLTMNINISTKQFMDSQLTGTILNAIKKNNLPPESLKLEITESLLIRNTTSMISKFSLLKEHGIRVVLDDFGTGYSSLSYIKDFQIDGIKIDRSFINDIDKNSGSAEIVKTILALCRNLGLKVVAEGVERKTQLNILKKLNCEKFQGFYFSKPLDRDRAGSMIQDQVKGSCQMTG